MFEKKEVMEKCLICGKYEIKTLHKLMGNYEEIKTEIKYPLMFSDKFFIICKKCERRLK